MASLNFYDLLYSELSKPDNCDDTKQATDITSSSENKTQECLISFEPLETNYIKLYCGHCFNYKPLLNEIYNQKYKKVCTETCHLKLNQIKCPYCRKVQNGILPYREGFVKHNYVNYPEKLSMLTSSCTYKYKNGIKKSLECNKPCCGEYCQSHEKLINKQNEKQKEKEIVKELNKNNPIKKKKPIHNLEYSAFVQTTTDISSINFITTAENYCGYIFKRGEKKGTQCNKKLKGNNQFCSIHKPK